ncbi:MAG: hypothetical protein JO067_02375 [Cupriavidus sp.]|nr:hypothetical protein [Cupriavidus sp.]
MSDVGVGLMSIFNCARPLLFENKDATYPYSIIGTAFIVRFRGRHFIVSAAHLLRNFEAHQVRFQYHPSVGDFVPWRSWYCLDGTDRDDPDQYDLVVFAVDDAALDYSRFKGYEPYNLLEIDALTIYSQRSSYAFRGFPTSLRTTDYDLHRIETQSVVGDGKYLGPSLRMHLHVLKVNRVADIGDFDGLSGSPVFQINHVDDRYSNEAFAGMAILGTAAAGTVEFLAHGRVVSALMKITDGDVAPSIKDR